MALFVASVVHEAVPAAAVPVAHSPLAGIILIAAGFALAAWSLATFARMEAEILPASRINSKVVEQGPFRYTRNPMYLGGLGLLLGVALWMGTLPYYLVVVVLFALIAFVFIPFEEAKMARQHPETFTAYKARVRRWL